MPNPSPYKKLACSELADQMFVDPNVVHVGIGKKYKDGKYLNQNVIVVGVKRKGDPFAGIQVPRTVNDYATDVQEFGELQAHGDVSRFPERFNPTKSKRRRPIPGGFSIGHPMVPVGTLGAWMRRNEETVAITNNHVAANLNQAAVGDPVYQPGVYDGGSSSDAVLELMEFAYVHMGDEPPPPVERVPPPPPREPSGVPVNKRWLSSALWKLWLLPANAVSRLIGCHDRAVVANMKKIRNDWRRLAVGAALHRPIILEHGMVFSIRQPWPNLVDAAVCRVRHPEENSGVVPTPHFIEGIGELVGIRDPAVGDRVEKSSRTTGITSGWVESIGLTRHSYGSEGTAMFDEQLIVRSANGSFSASGDSGAAVVDEDRYLVGLLCASGRSVSVANKISNVVSIMGVTV